MVSINDVVQVENANVIVFRGEKQLRIGRNGTLKVVETSPITESERAIQCIAK
jgi:ssDNA-binding replication factor A large subunit